METSATPDYPRGLTFEQVWASIQELRESQKETDRILRETAETDKRRREADERLAKEAYKRQKEADERQKEAYERQKEAYERQKEADEQLRVANEQRSKESAEQLKELKRIVNRNSRQMGDLHRRFGQLAEHLVAPNINKRFNELGYHFGSYAPGGFKLEDERGKVIAEIDILLENGETIMAVEVKTTPAVKDVEHHIRRLEILRDARRRINNDTRKIRGAIAGAIFGADEKKATIEAGLYVIEQSGDTMKIEVPEGFVPGEW